MFVSKDKLVQDELNLFLNKFRKRYIKREKKVYFILSKIKKLSDISEITSFQKAKSGMGFDENGILVKKSKSTFRYRLLYRLDDVNGEFNFNLQ